MQEKESVMVARFELKIPSLGITVQLHSANLVVPNSYPSDRIFNPHLTTVKDSYIYDSTCVGRTNRKSSYTTKHESIAFLICLSRISLCIHDLMTSSFSVRIPTRVNIPQFVFLKLCHIPYQYHQERMYILLSDLGKLMWFKHCFIFH